ncbi:hypothetical protein H4219_004051 [Mycoemilia scoparia]|uniref:HMG box domain-containing protein n=1 Tax=Mycoemilia scoparia TaxID=417184 RepID=A0A9W8A105_9FUNG|nr:hypothetical protein H4219_004051 [Mycoemilia scoparia]
MSHSFRLNTSSNSFPATGQPLNSNTTHPISSSYPVFNSAAASSPIIPYSGSLGNSCSPTFLSRSSPGHYTSQEVSPSRSVASLVNISNITSKDICEQLTELGWHLQKRAPEEKPGAVMRAPNSFILYRSDKAREIATSNPQLNQSEVSRMAADLWKQEPEHIKELYRQRQQEEKARCKNLSLQGGDTRDFLYRKNKRKHSSLDPSSSGSPSKPVNTFIRYRKDKMAQLQSANLDFTQIELSRMCSKMWRNESEEVKRYYRNQYRREKIELSMAQHNAQAHHNHQQALSEPTLVGSQTPGTSHNLGRSDSAKVANDISSTSSSTSVSSASSSAAAPAAVARYHPYACDQRQQRANGGSAFVPLGKTRSDLVSLNRRFSDPFLKSNVPFSRPSIYDSNNPTRSSIPNILLPKLSNPITTSRDPHDSSAPSYSIPISHSPPQPTPANVSKLHIHLPNPYRITSSSVSSRPNVPSSPSFYSSSAAKKNDFSQPKAVGAVAPSEETRTPHMLHPSPSYNEPHQPGSVQFMLCSPVSTSPPKPLSSNYNDNE